MAAEAVGVPVEKVELIGHDTAETGNSGSASASRMTFMAGNAIKGAAELALQKWQDEERPAIATYQYRPPKTTPYDPETGHAEPNFAYGYMAQFVEVEVDIETGHVDVVRVVSAHDVGKAINPQLIEGQIEGAVVQALGYAMMENLVTQRRADSEPVPLHLPDPDHLGYSAGGEIGHSGICRSERTLGRARHGRDAVYPAGPGDHGGAARRDRRLV